VSEQNVVLQRRLTEAFNARDIEAFIALCDPNIELHSTFAELGAVYHRARRGPEMASRLRSLPRR
jgi:hypothetical protein